MATASELQIPIVTYLEVVHRTGDGSFTDLVSVGVKDWDDGTTLCRVDVLDKSFRSSHTSRWVRWLLTLCACQAVAVGPVSDSPSPMTATVIISGLSMTLPYATARQ